MKTLYKSLLAFVAWVMLSVSALAVDVIVVSHGQANDPFWSVAKNLSLIHISEPTRQEAISYAVFCLKKKKTD